MSKRSRFCCWPATTLVASLAIAGVMADQPEVDHLIPPGYQPEEAVDEQGIWMEMEDFETSLNKSALLVRDVELVDYIGGIVCRVAGPYCNDFRVYLVRNPGFNASMSATGMMQIWTGLIVRANSSDEIAAVVGHEIAHYTRLHTLQGFRNLKSKMAAGSFFDLGLSLLTGVVAPVGQMGAMLSYLSYNRGQEEEADILGTRLLSEAGFDPHAAYQVWYEVLAEEEAAAVKSDDPGLFSRTHPESGARAAYLREYVNEQFGPPSEGQKSDPKFLEVLNRHYYFLMEDQLDTNRFGRTQEILRRHAEIGVDPGVLYFFEGEMYRQRGEQDDMERAMDAYLQATEQEHVPPEAYKNLGYLHLKTGNLPRAQYNFRKYLEIVPEASDRAMIEFYLEGEGP